MKLQVCCKCCLVLNQMYLEGKKGANPRLDIPELEVSCLQDHITPL